LAPLRLREKEGGVSVANGTSWKDSRIFFAGYGPQASTIGANRAGRTIARQAIAALSRFGRERREEADAILAAATRAAAIKESEAATVEAAATAAAAARALAQPQRAASTWPDVELPALRLGEAVTVATATDSAAAARTAIDLGTATATVIDIDTATETGIDIAAAIGTSAASGHGDDALAEGDDESKRDSSDSEPEA
jgi:hypothetical protein